MSHTTDGVDKELTATQIEALATKLRAIVPADAVLTNEEDLRPYECDGLSAYRQLPMIVVLPSRVEEIQNIMRICHQLQVPVVARGTGTGLSGGALPLGNGWQSNLKAKSITEPIAKGHRFVPAHHLAGSDRTFETRLPGKRGGLVPGESLRRKLPPKGVAVTIWISDKHIKLAIRDRILADIKTLNVIFDGFNVVGIVNVLEIHPAPRYRLPG